VLARRSVRAVTDEPDHFSSQIDTSPLFRGTCRCGADWRVSRALTTGDLDEVRHYRCDCGRDVTVVRGLT
jgi:hypothetical protein